MSVDTLRWDHLGAHGYPRNTSPNLDRFAEQGIVFEQAIVQWPKTSPSFASMLTSTYPFANGVRTTAVRLDDRFVSLAEHLKEAGYRTIGVVTNPNLERQFGFDQGFDDYTQTWKTSETPELVIDGPPSDARRATTFALDSVDRWQQAGGDEPLFLWVHYIDPHGPYRPAEPYRDLFLDDEWFDEDEVLSLRGPNDPPNPRWSVGCLNEIVMDGDERRAAYYVAQYDAEIRTVDEQFQVLLDGLEARGLTERSLIVFTADHGESLGDHNYYFEHGLFSYDACSRVPWFLRYPGSTPRRIDATVGLIDLVPTVLDLLELPRKGMLHGQSLRAVMERDGDAAPFVFTEAGYRKQSQQVVRTGRWKLIWVRDPKDLRLMTGSEYELYDVVADPLETRNVAAENPDVVERLSERLRQWLKAAVAIQALDANPAVELDPQTRQYLEELGYL